VLMFYNNNLVAFCIKGKDRAVAMPVSNRQLTGRLLACAYLTKVKIIKCCGDDVRVGALVRLFVDSGMDSKKIFVRQTRKNCES
jgi:hypothetical protein